MKYKVIIRSARAGVEFDIPENMKFVSVVNYNAETHEAHILVTVS